MKQYKKLITIGLTISAMTVQPALSEISAKKKNLIDQFIAVSIYSNNQGIVSSYKKEVEKKYFSQMGEGTVRMLTEKGKKIVKEEISAAFDQAVREKSLNQLMYKVYDRYFSQQELSDIINFFQSSTGQKLAKFQSELNYQRKMYGAFWANGIYDSVNQKIAQRLMDEDGFDKKALEE